MSPKKGRHRRGPGGPRRTSRVAPVPATGSPRPGPDVSGLTEPTLAQVVETVVASAGRSLDLDSPVVPGVQVEQWALSVAATAMAPGEMPSEFYADLGRGLLESADPLAPAVLAALALAVGHDDAAPLRQARRDWLLGVLDEATRDTDLGLGREAPVGAVRIDDTLVIGFASPGGDHTVGLRVEGPASDLWVGPALELVAADARADDDLRVTDVDLDEAIDLADAALAEADDDFAADDALVLPLLHRRLALLR